MAEKKCSKCGEARDLSKFPKSGRRITATHDGHQTVCRVCVNARNVARYAARPEVAEKAKANSRAQASKRFTSPYHRELWRAQKRRARWRKGSVPRAIKLAHAAERNALAARIKAARTAWQSWVKRDGSDADVAAYYLTTGKPWNNPRLSPGDKWKVRYHADPAFRLQEIAKSRQNKRTRRSQVARAAGGLSPERERELLTSATACYYCRCSLDADNRTLDHVIPLSKGGAHDETNVVPACRPCNSSKLAGPWPLRVAPRGPPL